MCVCVCVYVCMYVCVCVCVLISDGKVIFSIHLRSNYSQRKER